MHNISLPRPEFKVTFMYRPVLQAWLLGLGLVVPVVVPAQPDSAPEITAQGFDMSQPQPGWLKNFGRLRVRFEAPDRIAKLTIKERSYEVDLASTLESHNLELFGIETRPRNHKDITLDFESYINKKLEREGRYDFHLELVDKEGRSTRTTLSVIVNREKTSQELMEERRDRLARDQFSFRRVAAGPVVGATAFGITWKTIGSEKVTIRITKSDGGAEKLLRILKPTFDSLNTKSALASSAAEAKPIERIDLETASNGAAGEVFAVVIHDKPYLFKVNESKTLRSDVGTTVILNGEYKH